MLCLVPFYSSNKWAAALDLPLVTDMVLNLRKGTCSCVLTIPATRAASRWIDTATSG